MKLSISEFKKEITDLDKAIKQYYKTKENDETGLISDGVVNIGEYFKITPKILWILKEPYEEGDGTGEGFSLTEFINSDTFYSKIGRSKNTWNPIIYITHSILHNCLSYDDMDYIKDAPEMVSVLKKIAVINIQKLAAFSTTPNNSKIAKTYDETKYLLLSQIDVYSPDIIICGGTLFLLKKDLGLEDSYKHYKEFDYWIKDSKLYIDAWHPGFRPSEKTLTKPEYIDDIINIVKEANSTKR